MTKQVELTIKRQQTPDAPVHWESFVVDNEPGLNITTCLQRIAARPVTKEGVKTTPVTYDSCCLEEICGACTMIINGRVRQSCSALVDNILAERAGPIKLEPMTKYPLVRDLFVDRQRMFDNLQRAKAWIPVDGYYDAGAGPLVSPADQQQAYPLSQCMTCGCCTEACPQFNDKSPFIGPAAISQIILFNTHPTGRMSADERMEVLTGIGGIADCGNSQNCVKVCPKNIPLTDSIAKAGRAATLYSIKKFFLR